MFYVQRSILVSSKLCRPGHDQGSRPDLACIMLNLRTKSSERINGAMYCISLDMTLMMSNVKKGDLMRLLVRLQGKPEIDQSWEWKGWTANWTVIVMVIFSKYFVCFHFQFYVWWEIPRTNRYVKGSLFICVICLFVHSGFTKDQRSWAMACTLFVLLGPVSWSQLRLIWIKLKCFCPLIAEKQILSQCSNGPCFELGESLM